MAMTMEEFVKRTGAEVVGGNVIVGQMAERKIVANVLEGIFTLNADGQVILAALEANDPEAVTKRAPRKRAVDSAGKTAADVAEE